MAQSITVVVYPVSDLTAAKAIYSKFLEVEPYVDSEYYVGYKTDNLEVGLDPSASMMGVTTPVAYTDVTDINASIQTLVDAGAQLLREPKDVGGGMLIATVKDPDGNILGFRQG